MNLLLKGDNPELNPNPDPSGGEYQLLEEDLQFICNKFINLKTEKNTKSPIYYSVQIKFPFLKARLSENINFVNIFSLLMMKKRKVIIHTVVKWLK